MIQSQFFRKLTYGLAPALLIAVMAGTSEAAWKDFLKIKRTEAPAVSENDKIIEQLAENKVSKLGQMEWSRVEALPPALATKVILARVGPSKDKAIEDCKSALRTESNHSKFVVYATAFRHPGLGRQLAKLVDGYSSVKSGVFLSPIEKAVFLSLTATGNLPAGENPRAHPLVMQRNAVLFELRDGRLKESTVNALIRETVGLVSTLNSDGVFSPVVPRASVNNLAAAGYADNFSAALVLAIVPYLDLPVEDLKLLFQIEEPKKR